jgi:formylglycine-generating enzyme required for sulfatase activity
MRRLLVLAALLVALPAGAVEIDWAYVGNPGNAADTGANCFASAVDCGSVAVDYRISKHEVTNAQYAEFLNAVAKTDTYGLYNPGMSSNAIGGITRSGSSGSYIYAVKSGQGDNPVGFVSWYDALRFANWLHNGQPTGAQGAGTTETGAYTFTGAGSVGARNVGALAFLPTENEWYKAAYYDPTSAGFFNYPTGSNTAPSSDVPPAGANSANYYDGTFALTDSATFVFSFNYLTDVGAYASAESPYGTFDQGGNLWEWNEAGAGTVRGRRGGSFGDFASELAVSGTNINDVEFDSEVNGFRVASLPVPEPAQALLVLTGGLLLAVARRQRRL